MIIDTAEPMADGLRLTANGLGRLSFFRTSLVRQGTMNDPRVGRASGLGLTACGEVEHDG
jgi:hypothetical protein